MTPLLKILSMTHDEYCRKAAERLGRGSRHAGLIYEEFFRNGTVTGESPAFRNAGTLLQELIAVTDFSVLPLKTTRPGDDTTEKFLVSTAEGFEVEAVIIPMKSGGTLCISSQVGCRMGCAFCETGKMGLVKQLTTEEIVGQLWTARFVRKADLRNVVFMGMGEPFDNYDAVIQAARVITDAHGLSIGMRHVSVSTSGCIEGIEKLSNEENLPINLAVSINAPRDAVRNKLMPINRTHDMGAIHAAVAGYNRKTGNQVLIAYVLMANVNDRLEDADALADYLVGLNVKVNLIPYNPQTRDRFERPTMAVVEAFKDRLRERGYITLLRVSRGDDVMAACGQLGNRRRRSAQKTALPVLP